MAQGDNINTIWDEIGKISGVAFSSSSTTNNVIKNFSKSDTNSKDNDNDESSSLVVKDQIHIVQEQTNLLKRKVCEAEHSLLIERKDKNRIESENRLMQARIASYNLSKKEEIELLLQEAANQTAIVETDLKRERDKNKTLSEKISALRLEQEQLRKEFHDVKSQNDQLYEVADMNEKALQTASQEYDIIVKREHNLRSLLSKREEELGKIRIRYENLMTEIGEQKISLDEARQLEIVARETAKATKLQLEQNLISCAEKIKAVEKDTEVAYKNDLKEAQDKNKRLEIWLQESDRREASARKELKTAKIEMAKEVLSMEDSMKKQKETLLEEYNDIYRVKLSELRAEIGLVKKERESQALRITQLRTEMSSKEDSSLKEMACAKEHIHTLDKELERTQQELVNERKKIADLKVEKAIAEAALEPFKRKAELTERELKQQEDTQNRDITNLRLILEKERFEKSKTISEYQRRLDDCNRQIRNISSELADERKNRIDTMSQTESRIIDAVKGIFNYDSANAN